MDTKIIEYYKREVYGNTLEYIRDLSDAAQVSFLTGKKTINSSVRLALTDLTDGRIRFVQCMPPVKA